VSGGAIFDFTSANFTPPEAALVHFGKVHAVGKLQAGDLPGVVLDLKICRHQRNVNRLALSGAAAFGTNAIKFQIPVMGHHEFIYDSVHSFTIVLAVSSTANRSKTLEPCFLSTSRVTLPP
jgi:hypothetical protein